LRELLCNSEIPSDKRRRDLVLTQEQLAAKAGVRQRTISDIKRSTAARFDTVLRVLAALSLTWWFDRAQRVHPKTLRDSSNAPAKIRNKEPSHTSHIEVLPLWPSTYASILGFQVKSTAFNL
jgi:transcriptional regulator with XRE-family HTH domain